jgi:cytosine/adenosine deaminase-related metal-dependent hydrolase
MSAAGAAGPAPSVSGRTTSASGAAPSVSGRTTGASGRTVLRGARYPGDLAIAGGRVVAMGTVGAQPGDVDIDCDGDIVTAGLVNTHHHLYQWMTRGRATCSDLFGWLQELYPVWNRLDVEDVEAAALVGLAEIARSGTTTVFDHHYVVPRGDDSVFDAIARSASAVGVRLYLSRGSMDLGEKDGGLPPDDIVEDVEDILESTERVAGRLHDGELVNVVVAPCSPFSTSEELMRESAFLARELGLRLHTHLAETLDEERDCLARFGCRPLDYVERLGWSGPDVWYAHGVHLSAEETARVGRAGSGVAHCPSSNGRLGSGLCPVRDLLDAGAPVGLGVDGAASQETGVLHPEMRQALYVARLRAGRADALTPAEALDMATRGGAACLGRADLGRLEVGGPADLAVWPGDDIADMPDPVAALVLGPDRRVRHLFVAGREVVRDGALVGVDLAAARAALATRARRLWD